jgi:hypothetical protein
MLAGGLQLRKTMIVQRAVTFLPDGSGADIAGLLANVRLSALCHKRTHAPQQKITAIRSPLVCTVNSSLTLPMGTSRAFERKVRQSVRLGSVCMQ